MYCADISKNRVVAFLALPSTVHYFMDGYQLCFGEPAFIQTGMRIVRGGALVAVARFTLCAFSRLFVVPPSQL